MYFGRRRSRKEMKEKRRTGSYVLRGLYTIAKTTSFAAKFACTRKQERVCHREGLRQAQRRLGKTRYMCRPPEIDVTAEAPETDRLRHCERSRELGDYRPWHRRTVLTQAMHRLPTAKNAYMRKPSRSVR